jgi:DNA-binding MarR family transcriptional regulator
MAPTYHQLVRNEVEAPSEPSLAAAQQIRRGVGALGARMRAERAGLLSLTQSAVLGRVHQHGPVTPGELANRLRAKPQSLTRTLASLEESDLVRRMPDPDDRRQSLLTITPAGRAALAEEMRPRDTWLAGALERELTTAERDLLVIAATLLERLADTDPGPAPVEP